MDGFGREKRLCAMVLIHKIEPNFYVLMRKVSGITRFFNRHENQHHEKWQEMQKIPAAGL